MSSRVSWSVDGIDPSLRDRAEALARRAGMSLSDWLESTLPAPSAETRAANFQDLEPRPVPVSRDVAEIQERLASIARQIEQIAPRRTDAPREPGVARQLGEAISRLDAQLAQIAGPPPPRGHEVRDRRTEARLRAVLEEGHPDPRNAGHRNPGDRNDGASRPLPLRGAVPAAPPSPPTPPGPDSNALERHLARIASQIEALQRPDAIAQSIAGLRDELTEIRNTILDALPRHTLDSLETEIRSLSRRIDDGRASAADDTALVGIERTLSEIREMLRADPPVRELAGHDEAIRSLSEKLDTMLRGSDDPDTVQPLENAIAVLRAIVANVASNEALARLSEDVELLSSRIDQLTRRGEGGDPFAAIETRIAALAAALEGRDHAQVDDRSAQLEDALRTLSERIDRLTVDHEGAATFADLERRVSQLLTRLDASDEGGNTSRVEHMLQEILGHLERQHAIVVSLSDTTQRGTEDGAVIDLVKRELTDIRLGQGETGRHTKDSLESVNTTLGHVVDRLTLIEGDLRNVRPASPSDIAAPPGPDDAPPSSQGEAELSSAARPAAFVAARRVLHAPGPIGEEASSSAELPPDHPLEPGTRPPGLGASAYGMGSLEAASEIPAAFRPPVSSASFIAAARRAAQAAATAQAAPDKGRPARRGAGGDHADRRSWLGSRLRAALAAASVALIVLGAAKPIMSLLQGRPAPSGDSSNAPEHDVAPRTTSPSPHDQKPGDAAPEQRASADSRREDADITGAIATGQAPPRKPSPIKIPTGESLPEAIGGPKLRAAALNGDPAAAYEVAVRFAEGKGAAVDFEEAVKWYERAASAGLPPAAFRLGTLFEKGLGVRRDVDAARRYYVEAAERGNAKAMHNLALLDADGAGKGPDYRSAAQWFLKAAEHGLADSQFNLGVLYARGVGVGQSFSESFKWLSLAASQGDADAERKRDDVASRMEEKSLAAAKLEIERFVAETQPDDAVHVPAPPGGWDTATAIKPAAATPGTTVRASR